MPYREAGKAIIEIMNMKKAASASIYMETLNIGNEVWMVAAYVDLVSNKFAEKITIIKAPNIDNRLPRLESLVFFCVSSEAAEPRMNIEMAMGNKFDIFYFIVFFQIYYQ